MKSFEDLYQELRTVGIQELRDVWRKANIEKEKRSKISIIVCLIINVLIIFNLKKYEFTFMLFLVLILIEVFISSFIFLVVSLVFSKEEKKYKIKYKQHIMGEIISNFYDNLEYFPGMLMPKNIYDESQIIESYNIYDSKDYFKAKINNTYDIEMSEIKTILQGASPDGAVTSVKFHGLFTRIAIDKSINSELCITKRGNLLYNNKGKLELDSRRI